MEQKGTVVMQATLKYISHIEMLTERVRQILCKKRIMQIMLQLGCGIIDMSEKKVVCFSSFSHISLFLGFVCDSGKNGSI